MTDLNKLQNAFFRLLEDYQNNIDMANEGDLFNNYCYRYCPFCRRPYSDDTCPAQIFEEGYDEYDIDEKICREEILKWYVENSQ